LEPDEFAERGGVTARRARTFDGVPNIDSSHGHRAVPHSGNIAGKKPATGRWYKICVLIDIAEALK